VKSRYWLKLGVCLALLALVFGALEPTETFSALGGISAAGLGAALLLLPGAYLTNGLRLYWFSTLAGAKVAPRLFGTGYALGLFFNGLLPTGVGGDAVRVVLLGKRGFPWSPLVMSSLVDRWFGLMGVVALGGGALVWVHEAIPIATTQTLAIGWFSGGGALLGFCAVPLGDRLLPWLSAALLPEAWNGKVNGAWSSSRRLLSQWSLLPGGVALSLLSHTLVVLAYAVCGASLVTGVSVLARLFRRRPVRHAIARAPDQPGGAWRPRGGHCRDACGDGRRSTTGLGAGAGDVGPVLDLRAPRPGARPGDGLQLGGNQGVEPCLRLTFR